MSPGLDGDDICGDRADGECCGDSGDDVLGRHRPVQQEDVDQGAGSAGVAVGFSCCGPECLVSGRELSGRSSVGECGRAGKSAGLAL